MSFQHVCTACPHRHVWTCKAHPAQADIRTLWHDAEACPEDRFRTIPLPVLNDSPPPPARKKETAKQKLARIGPKLWAKLHTATAPGPALIDSITKALPCGDCRKHWRAFRRDNPPDFGAGWRAWVLRAHNAVNRRLDRPEWTQEKADARWERGSRGS